MSVNDVSLTSGMRSNLLSLQNTVDLLNRTQGRLSSGKKVNTAIDNPTSFFASKALTDRASIIDSLKDAMGQAVQTITAADKGITAITSMIEQAKGIAQSALSAEAGNGFSSVTISLDSVAVGDALTITNAGASTAVLTAAATPAAVGSIDVLLNAGNTIDAGETFVVAGKTYTASVGGTSEGLTVVIGATSADTAINLNARINANAGGAVTSSIVTAGTVHIVAGSVALTDTTVTSSATDPAEATITNNAGTPGVNEFVRTGDNNVDAVNLAKLINNEAGAAIGTFNTALTTLHTEGYTATANNGVVTLTKDLGTTAAAAVTLADNVTASSASMARADVAATTELSDLVAQFNTMRTQIDELAEDSGYKGKNLLSATTAARSMNVVFEGTTLTVLGFDATTGAAGLNVTSAANGATTTWTTGGATAINASIDQLDTALSTMRQNSSKLAGNLSIITVRQDFSTNMINTLTAGSDKLTLADANEEGANMLMLQTRQSLSTTALSLSAQAAQSVLKLFQ